MPWNEGARRRLKLRDLDILMTVAQAGSMGRAAERLHMFQPGVSKAIADLEATFGVRLVDRSRQGVELTPYGLALLRRGAAVFDELKQAAQDIDFLLDSTTGELRIGGQDPIVAGLIPAIVARLSRQYPRILFNVTPLSADVQLYRALRERIVELQIHRVPRSFKEEDLEVEYLFEEPLVIAAGSENPWARRRQIELSELIDEPWVLPQPDHSIGMLISEIFASMGLERPKRGVVSSSLHVNDALLATGRYLAFYPGSFLRLSAKRLSIKVLPVKLPKGAMPVSIVTLKNRTLSPIAKLFIEEARRATSGFERVK
jgi:DNA-binding transcriptional LysR family regulator